FSPGPLPIIGVRRGIMQSRAHDDAHRTAPHSSGAHDFRAPLEWRGPMTVVFHEARDRWIRGLLARNPCAIVIEPVHTRADSCGLRGLPPRAIRRKSHFAPGGLIVFRTAYVDGPRSARA